MKSVTRLLLLICALTFAHGQSAVASEISRTSTHHLMLDTGGHTALVRALVFSLNGKTLYSGGDDRVVRVWDWQAGTTQFFIRVPVGQGEFGKVYALALSPNERFLAIAAETRPVCKTRGCMYILIYDAKNGEFLRGLNGGHSGQVLSLSFSRDG